jgi:hypothetical protein
MLKTALIAVTVLAVAAPALAKGAKKGETAPAGWENAAPIPYSDLAAADSKINGGGGAKRHTTRSKGAKAADQAGSTEAAKPAQ